MLNLTPIVRNLLIINIAIYIIQGFVDISFAQILGMHYLRSALFEPYQFMSYMFVHGDFMHLFHNMFAVFMFAPALEYALGSQRFTTFYLACGLGAGLIYGGIQYWEISQLEQAKDLFLAIPTVEHFQQFMSLYSKDFALISAREYEYITQIFPQNASSPEVIAHTKSLVEHYFGMRANVPMVGASGAVFGILVGFGILYPNLEMFILFLPIPIRAKYLIGAYLIWEIYATIQQNPYDNVAHVAHLGGALVGFLLIYFWLIKKRY